MAAASPEPRGLFAAVNFHIVLSNALPESLATEISSKLLAHGATQHAPPSHDGQCMLDGLSHMIAADVDFERAPTAEDRMVAVVSPAWVESSLVRNKLANPKSHSPDPRMFFSGLVVHPAGLPRGDEDAIIGGVLAMGGLYSSTLTRLVTHIVAPDASHSSCETARAKGLAAKAVLPHWIDDCLKLGKCIDERPYQHPNPEILMRGEQDTVNGAAPADLSGVSSTQAAGLLTPGGSPMRQQSLDVLRSKTVCLAADLSLSPRLRRTIEELISKAGGKVSVDVTECDMLVCQHRVSSLYAKAYNAGKSIGSLSWLYWMISHNTWTSPLKRLLHYPTDPRGLPGFGNFRICLSNYSGEARIFLENLAKAAGSEFTKTMKTDNTHLITAHKASEKCDAALEWGIKMVNHLWLEESYARWQVQDVSNPRYTFFPSRTNLTEVVGQTQMDKIALDLQFQQNFGEAEESVSEGEEWESAPGSESGLGMDGAGADPKLNINLASPQGSPPKAAGRKSKLDEADDDAFTTPAPKKRRSLDKENEAPSTMSTGSRSAKAQATVKLHNLAPDIALYEKEKKRRGGVVFGGRRSLKDAIEERKRPSPEPEDDGGRLQKKAKNSKEPLRLRMLMTGVSKYDGHDKASAKLRDRLRELGILLTESENNCKYLVAPRIIRTKKFVCGIAQAPMLVSPEFLDDCLEENEVLDPKDYPFQDHDGEKEFQIRLDAVLNRAAANRQRLLKGYAIWVTSGVKGGFEVYKSIVDTNGGSCRMYQARASAIPRIKYDSDDEDRKLEPAYLVCGEDEGSLAEKFQATSREAGRDPQVVRTDWLLDAALSQEVGDAEGYRHETWS